MDRSPRRRRTALQRLRHVGNWVNLTTPLGLAVARLGGATTRRGPSGLVLAEGYRLSFPVAGAFTIGNVVTTGGSWDELLRTQPGLLGHEEAHSWQYLGCGLAFFPLYGAAMAWSVLRTGDRAAGHVFERRAGLALGGYREHPPRPLGPAVRTLLGRARRR